MKSDCASHRALFDFIIGHQNIRWDIRDLPPLPKPNKRLADIVEDLPDGTRTGGTGSGQILMNQTKRRGTKTRPIG